MIVDREISRLEQQASRAAALLPRPQRRVRIIAEIDDEEVLFLAA